MFIKSAKKDLKANKSRYYSVQLEATMLKFLMMIMDKRLKELLKICFLYYVLLKIYC